MKRILFINLQKEIFTGNVLDIGLENNGIIYNVYKSYNKKFEIDYIEKPSDKVTIEEHFYDNCILFFTLNNFSFKKSKVKFLQEVFRYLNDKGYVYIWDIDKGYKKTMNCILKVMLPNDIIKEINIKDYNIIKDNSFESTLKLLKNNFQIVESRCSNGIYYIKAKKKGRINSESNIGCS